MAAVISTTDAACSEEPEASSEAISLTELAAEATSIELRLDLLRQHVEGVGGVGERRRQPPGSVRERSEQFTRSPARSRSRAWTSVRSIPSRRRSVLSTRSRRFCCER